MGSVTKRDSSELRNGLVCTIRIWGLVTIFKGSAHILDPSSTDNVHCGVLRRRVQSKLLEALTRLYHDV